MRCERDRKAQEFFLLCYCNKKGRDTHRDMPFSIIAVPAPENTALRRQAWRGRVQVLKSWANSPPEVGRRRGEDHAVSGELCAVRADQHDVHQLSCERRVDGCGAMQCPRGQSPDRHMSASSLEDPPCWSVIVVHAASSSRVSFVLSIAMVDRERIRHGPSSSE